MKNIHYHYDRSVTITTKKTLMYRDLDITISRYVFMTINGTCQGPWLQPQLDLRQFFVLLREQCSSGPCAAWSAGAWSSCSPKCGQGKQLSVSSFANRNILKLEDILRPFSNLKSWNLEIKNINVSLI